MKELAEKLPVQKENFSEVFKQKENLTLAGVSLGHKKAINSRSFSQGFKQKRWGEEKRECFFGQGTRAWGE